MLAGTLVWEFGQSTLSLTPDLARELGLGSDDASRIDITAFRDRIGKEDLDLVYERMSRSFLRAEPMINVYGLSMADGRVVRVRVRSTSRWEMSDIGKPTRFVAVLSEIDAQVQSMIEDEFIERMIDLRFLAERWEDDRYRRIVDSMLQEVWKHRRPT